MITIPTLLSYIRRSIMSSTSSNRLFRVLSQLTLILFLITSSYCSPIQQQFEESNDTSTPELFSARSTSSSSNSSFPTAFDTLGNNFTASSCPAFFADFLANETYKSCDALSLLLQNSNTFFKDLASAVTLDQVLDTSCSANITSCSTYMSALASNLTSTDNCGADYKLGNPMVTQAYEGMVSYEPIAKAACLEDPSTNDYCFTEAATNSSNISDYYLYFTPLGNALPGGSRPSCNKCTQATMAVFLNSALIKGNPLVQTYIPAAEIINVGCGSNFVNASVNVGSQDSSSTKSTTSASVLTAPPPSLTTLLGYMLIICMGLVSIT